MKTLILLFMFLCAMSSLQAQARLSLPDALGQLYQNYDPDHGTAQWQCTKGQEETPKTEGWPCWKEYATVVVSVVLMMEVGENGTDKVYLVASAKPANFPSVYDCHACAPAIGVAVFQATEGDWALRSANPAVGFYGGWGKPPEVSIVPVGLQERGFLLSTSDIAQGYAWSSKTLLLPIGRTVAEVWSIQDQQDNHGAIDPDDKLNKQVPYRSSAAFKFVSKEPAGADEDWEGHYDIEVISRGAISKDLIHLKPENWTELYRFSDGKYRLLQHRDFIEVKKSTKKPPV